MQTNYSSVSSLRSSNQNSYHQHPGTLNTSENSTTDTEIDDTIHYISPATSSTRTEYEGDIYYRFYPSYPKLLGPVYSYASSSTISCMEPKIQKTLAIVKPEAMIYKDVILRAVNHQAGFIIVNARTIQATPEQISELYAEHYGSPSFPHLVVTMSAAPILILSLMGLNAVERWKNMIGPYKALKEEWFFPTSVRRRFGLHEEIPDALHASETVQLASKENRYFFPKSILEPLTSDEEKITDYCNLYINPTLLKGLTLLAKIKPLDPIRYLAEWLLLNNPYQPKFSEEISLTPT